MKETWEWWWDVKGTERREQRLRKAALLLPRRVRRAAERPGPRRVMTPEEVMERFLDDAKDGVIQWAKRYASRVRRHA